KLMDEQPQPITQTVEEIAGNVAAGSTQELFCGMRSFVLLRLPTVCMPVTGRTLVTGRSLVVGRGLGGSGTGSVRSGRLRPGACSDALMRHSPARRQHRRPSVTI